MPNCRNPAPVIDMVRIVSVIPDSGLIPDSLIDLSISVAYELRTREQGVLSFGFNMISPDLYVMAPAADTVIQKGAGDITIHIPVRPKKWSDANPFTVYASISPYPPDPFDQPLVYSIYTLKF